MEQGRKQKTRVLFFAWGDSIHARRRIGIFTEDSSFKVGVISTFPYNFANAENFLLNDIRFIRSRLGLIKGLFIASVHAIKIAKRFKPDVIFLQTLLYPNYISYFLPRRIPIIITFWNGDVTWWAQWDGIERAFKKKIVEYGARRAKVITVNSKEALEACVGYGASRDNIKLIRYPGVKLDLFPSGVDKEKAREKLGVSHGKMVLCPRGSADYLNNDVIFEAAAKVIQQIPDTCFVFVGVGGWQKYVELAEKLGISSNIRFVGHVPWESIPDYYQAAEVMVSMSSNDSLPNCMLEAMASGIPVIMGDIPQIREWVVDGKNGYLVSVRDPDELSKKILKIMVDPDGTTRQFVERNLDLVKREVDSVLMSKLIKNLVHSVAIETEK